MACSRPTPSARRASPRAAPVAAARRRRSPGRGGAPGAPGAAPARTAPQAAPAAPPAPPRQPPASEDCLTVNVWTNAANANARRPVMMWIYGGGFTGGSGGQAWYDGEDLAAKGAVIVTMNYRLGAFGFFAHPELAKEVGPQRLRQLRDDGRDRRAAVDQAEHRRVRRRPEQRDDRRRVGRRDHGRRARRHRRRPRASSTARSSRAAAWMGLQMGAHDDGRRRRRAPAPRRWRRPASSRSPSSGRSRSPNCRTFRAADWSSTATSSRRICRSPSPTASRTTSTSWPARTRTRTRSSAAAAVAAAGAVARRRGASGAGRSGRGLRRAGEDSATATWPTRS